MKRPLITISAICLMLAACAAPGPAQRDKLTKAEIKTMMPEILAHRRCMARKVVAYSGSGTNLNTMVTTARTNCRTKLAPVATKLRGFDLSKSARARYLRAVETTASNVVSDAYLKASAKARRNRSSGETRL